jgi:hypothetical protein
MFRSHIGRSGRSVGPVAEPLEALKPTKHPQLGGGAALRYAKHNLRDDLPGLGYFLTVAEFLTLCSKLTFERTGVLAIDLQVATAHD